MFDLTEIPPEIFQAAQLLERWFKEHGAEKWALCGVQSRIFDLPCQECGGKGGVDSGGMTPWGSGIDVECPSCSNKS
jgi:hypothetical protein